MVEKCRGGLGRVRYGRRGFKQSRQEDRQRKKNEGKHINKLLSERPLTKNLGGGGAGGGN